MASFAPAMRALAPAQYVRDISAHHAAFIGGSVIVSVGAFLVIAAMAGAMRLAPGAAVHS